GRWLGAEAVYTHRSEAGNAEGNQLHHLCTGVTERAQITPKAVCIDVGLSVMAIKKTAHRIDLDTEDNIFHLKIKSPEVFEEWVSKLRIHRSYRQNDIATYPYERPLFYPHYPPSARSDTPTAIYLHNRAWNCGSPRKDGRLTGPDPPLQTAYSPADASQLQDTFCRVANDLYLAMSSALCALTSERDRLKQALDPAPGSGPTPSTHLETSQASEVPDGCLPLHAQVSMERRVSVPESLYEFFDAQEVLLSSSSSENEASDDESYLSDVSDSVSVETYSSELEREEPKSGCEQHNSPSWRRVCLPAVSAGSGSFSVWSVLRRNIGKDLSCVAMPVQLNQPLNTLQRLWGKPFNPVLGETYECDRPDMGFRFIAEQVSHHPPISACYAESKHFIFWQDVRWKNKFWGKSMEIIPVGSAHVLLPDSAHSHLHLEGQPLLCPTDTRFRPDQRKSEDDTWVSNNTYWELRKDPGFSRLDCPSSPGLSKSSELDCTNTLDRQGGRGAGVTTCAP
ncbi:hypothetical protein JZ751_016247, partial [Albula glossodonta]